jgi:hypothetical protein
VVDHRQDGRRQIVRHEEHDPAVVGELADERDDVLRGLWVQSARGLVQEQHLGGAREQLLAEVDPLALPA